MGTYPHDDRQPEITGSEPAQGFPVPNRDGSAPDGREPVPGSRDSVPGSRDAVPGSRSPLAEVDPNRTNADDLSALKARIAQLEAEAEARNAAQRRAEQLSEIGFAPGGNPVEHFHRLIDGTVVRGFGTATQIADGDKPPLPVVESFTVPTAYDDHYNAVAPNRSE